MANEALRELLEKAIADYGFRQALLWGTDSVLDAADVEASEAEALRERVLPEVEALPVPVEPGERAAELARLLALVDAPG